MRVEWEVEQMLCHRKWKLFRIGLMMTDTCRQEEEVVVPPLLPRIEYVPWTTSL